MQWVKWVVVVNVDDDNGLVWSTEWFKGRWKHINQNLWMPSLHGLAHCVRNVIAALFYTKIRVQKLKSHPRLESWLDIQVRSCWIEHRFYVSHEKCQQRELCTWQMSHKYFLFSHSLFLPCLRYILFYCNIFDFSIITQNGSYPNLVKRTHIQRVRLSISTLRYSLQP